MRQVQREVKLTNADNVELETTLQQFTLNLVGDAVEAHMALGNHRTRYHACCCHCCDAAENGVNDPSRATLSQWVMGNGVSKQFECEVQEGGDSNQTSIKGPTSVFSVVPIAYNTE